jgi:homoserine kinase type II
LTAVLTNPPPSGVLDQLGLRGHRVTVLKDVPGGNANWLLEAPGRGRVVLRRYHAQATPAGLSYEHSVLGYLARTGWVVPEPVGGLVQHEGLWYCLTRFVPGGPAGDEGAGQRRRRGRDLARLHLALRGLGERLGQRPGWRAQHAGVTVHAGIDWAACLRGLAQVSPRLGSWAAAAAIQAQDALAAVGADGLPVTVIHGDFAEWNVHYERGHLAGIIDFGLTHLDSRPYELAIARTYRSPETIDAYRGELACGGWPLSDLEEAAIEPINRAFRVDMAAWQMEHGHRTGDYDLAMIERQLSRTGTAPP